MAKFPATIANTLMTYISQVKTTLNESNMDGRITVSQQTLVLRSCREAVVWLCLNKQSDNLLVEERYNELRRICEPVIALLRPGETMVQIPISSFFLGYYCKDMIKVMTENDPIFTAEEQTLVIETCNNAIQWLNEVASHNDSELLLRFEDVKSICEPIVAKKAELIGSLTGPAPSTSALTGPAPSTSAWPGPAPSTSALTGPAPSTSAWPGPAPSTSALPGLPGPAPFKKPDAKKFKKN